MAGKKVWYTILSCICMVAVGISSLSGGWIEAGMPISVAPSSQWLPQIVSDNAGGAIMVWQDYRDENWDIYAQRVDERGDVLWQVNGIGICTAPAQQEFPQIVTDGSGGAIITWQDGRDGNWDVYAQRVDLDGNALWDQNGIAVTTDAANQYYPILMMDVSGGALITWQDERGAETKVYAQGVDASGSPRWVADGITVSTATGSQTSHDMVTDGVGGTVVSWIQRDGNGETSLYAQRIDSDGVRQWTDDGVTVDASGFITGSCIITDGAGGAVMIWSQYRNGNADVYAQRIDSNGNIQWNPDGVAVCVASGDQWIPDAVGDGAGGSIVTWMDGRDGNADVFAQMVDADGNIQWTQDGTVVCNEAQYQVMPRLVSDGAGGAIITWSDYRSSNNYDIYVQRIDQSGILRWLVGGVALCVINGDQIYPQVASDGEGGAIVVWEDWRSDSNIYCQRVTESGNLVATLLASFSARFMENCITVTWTLSEVDEDVQFFIQRANANNGQFEELAHSEIERKGQTFSYSDFAIEPGKSYRYRVDVGADDGRKVLFEVGPISVACTSLALFQNYPNPFNPSTTISYYLPADDRVSLEIYDAAGRVMARLVEGEQPSGHYSIRWRGRDTRGDLAPSGVYFYRLKVGKRALTRKMILLR